MAGFQGPEVYKRPKYIEKWTRPKTLLFLFALGLTLQTLNRKGSFPVLDAVSK